MSATVCAVAERSLATVGAVVTSSAPLGALTDRGPRVFIVTLVVTILATIFTALRLISKWGIVRKSTADDWLTVVAWLFMIGMSVAVMTATQLGLGAPDAELPAIHRPPLRRAYYASTAFYYPAVMATKTAILVLYIRMAAAHRFLRLASIATLVVVALSGVILTFLGVFRCKSIVAFVATGNSTQCIDLVVLYSSSAPVNVLTDLAILLLPLPILTSLRLESRQKGILVATFVVGGFVAIVDIVRIAYLQTAYNIELAVAGLKDGTSSTTAIISHVAPGPDYYYHVSYAIMWSAVEVGVGLMCSCVLVLKPLVMRVLPNFLRSGCSSDRQTLARTDNEQPTQVIPVVETRSMAASPGLDDTPSGQIATLDECPREEKDDHLGFLDMLDSCPICTSRSPESQECTCPSRSGQTDTHTHVHIGQQSGSLPNAAGKTLMPSRQGQAPTQRFFDFVNMNESKSLLQLSAKQAWTPILFVSILFFLWGFSYGFLGTLTGAVQDQLNYSMLRTVSLHNVYWLAYFCGPPLFGYPVLSRVGFKATFITGLTIYSVGAMAFWPSFLLLSFPGFVVSQFLCALGLSCLEVAANPFIALAGPSELSEARLLFIQGIQAIGSILSPIVAQYGLVNKVDELNLLKIQWCYLVVAIFVLLLAIVFYYVPLPEVTDCELEAYAARRLAAAGTDPSARVFGLRAALWIAIPGVVVMTFYVGAQESVRWNWGSVITHINPLAASFWQQTIGRGAFAAGRFIASALAYWRVSPTILLAISLGGAMTASILALALSSPAGALATLHLSFFFQAPVFPIVFAMTLRGQGRRTKIVSTGLTMAIAGGCLWPSVAYAILLKYPDNPKKPLILVTLLFGLSLLWPGMLCHRALRKWVSTRPLPPPSPLASEDDLPALVLAKDEEHHVPEEIELRVDIAGRSIATLDFDPELSNQRQHLIESNRPDR